MTEAATRASVKDYQQLPEGAKYQLIDGEIITMPSPTVKHQKISLKLTLILGAIIEQKNLGTFLYSPMDVYLDEENVLQPDLLFVSKTREKIIKKDGIHGAPDVVIEILSPHTAYYDNKKKRLLYEKYGVREYWLIDPEDKEVIGYHRDEKDKLSEVFRENGMLISTLMDCTINF